MIGIPIGILIGVITGLFVLLMIRTAWKTGGRDLKGIVTLVAEFLPMPAFWFGGSWVGGTLLKSTEWAEILPYYLVALVFTFVAIASLPLIKIVVNVAREIEKEERSSGD